MTLTFGPPKSGWDFKGKNAKRVYIAGGMRGYENFNFPAFDRAAEQLRAKGWTVLSPAEMDRAIGIDETVEELPDNFIFDALRRDFAGICTVDAIVFLPGWERSSGARAEARVGLDIGLDFYEIGPRGGLARLHRANIRKVIVYGC